MSDHRAPSKPRYMGMGIAIGTGLGVALGVVLGTASGRMGLMGVGIGLGTGCGTAIGAALDARNKMNAAQTLARSDPQERRRHERN
jgi:hypothetical protein